MELYEEILRYASEVKDIPFFTKREKEKFVEGECYKALKKIQKILENEELSDAVCFWKIEEIVKELEKIGVSLGGRHDF